MLHTGFAELQRRSLVLQFERCAARTGSTSRGTHSLKIMITSTTNQRVKWIRQLQSRRSARHDEGHFVIEGSRLLQEALDANAQISLVLHEETPEADQLPLLEALSRHGAELLPASASVLAACSDTETPQGLLAVVAVPEPTVPPGADPLLIVDRVGDPGNLGSLMRSALAAGVAWLLLTPGTVDVLNPKVVRGAMGAHFHLPFKAVTPDELQEHLNGLTLWVAEAGRGLRYDSVDWSAPSALLVGSEAHGPSAAALKLEHHYVHIPIKAASDSLNAAVAGSIILFEIARRRGFE